MFLRLPIIQDDEHRAVTVNVTHIVSLEYVNSRNIDAGTIVYLKDSRYWESPITIDVLQLRIDKLIERFGNQILVTYLSDSLPKPTKKKAVKKTTAKTVKY
jgi:hypothetical protein